MEQFTAGQFTGENAEIAEEIHFWMRGQRLGPAAVPVEADTLCSCVGTFPAEINAEAVEAYWLPSFLLCDLCDLCGNFAWLNGGSRSYGAAPYRSRF